MRRIIITMMALVFMMVLASPLLAEVGYQNRYVIASKAYLHVSRHEYTGTYRAVKRVDRSAAQVMIDAAKDECLYSIREVFRRVITPEVDDG
jgi:hypothetical protein